MRTITSAVRSGFGYFHFLAVDGGDDVSFVVNRDAVVHFGNSVFDAMMNAMWQQQCRHASTPIDARRRENLRKVRTARYLGVHRSAFSYPMFWLVLALCAAYLCACGAS